MEENEELDLTKVDITSDYQAGSKMKKYDLICFQIIEKNICQALKDVNLTDLFRMLSIVVNGNSITISALYNVLEIFFGKSKGEQILSWLILPFFNLQKNNNKDDLNETESYEEYLTFNLKLIISKELDCFSFVTLFSELDNETGSPKFNLDNLTRIKSLDLISVMLFFLFFGNESNDKKAEILFDLLDYEKTGQLRTGKKVFYVIFRKIILLTLFFSDIIVNYSVYLHSKTPDLLAIIDREQLSVGAEGTPNKTPNCEEDKLIFYQAYTDILFEYKKILFYLRHSRGIMKDLVTFISHSFIFYENMTNPLVPKELFKTFCKESKYSIFNPGRYREYLITYLFHNQRKSTLFLMEFPRMIHNVEDKYIQVNKKKQKEQNMIINELNLRDEFIKFQSLISSRENIVKMFIKTEKYINKKDLNDLKKQTYKKQNKMNKRELDKEITEIVEKGDKNTLAVENILNEFNNELERQREKEQEKDVKKERNKVKKKSAQSNNSAKEKEKEKEKEENEKKEKDLFKLGKIGKLSRNNQLGQNTQLNKINQMDKNGIIDEEEDNFECDKMSKLSKSLRSYANSELQSINNNNDNNNNDNNDNNEHNSISNTGNSIVIEEKEKEIDIQRPIYTGSNEPSAIISEPGIMKHDNINIDPEADDDEEDEDDDNDENDDKNKNVNSKLKEIEVDNPNVRMFRIPQRKEKYQPNKEQIIEVKNYEIMNNENPNSDSDANKQEEEEVIKIIAKHRSNNEDSKNDISIKKSNQDVQPMIKQKSNLKKQSNEQQEKKLHQITNQIPETQINQEDKSIDITNQSKSYQQKNKKSHNNSINNHKGQDQNSIQLNKSQHSINSKQSSQSKPSIQKRQPTNIPKEPSNKDDSDIVIIPTTKTIQSKDLINSDNNINTNLNIKKEQDEIQRIFNIPQRRLSANSNLFQDKDEYSNNPMYSCQNTDNPVINQEDGDEVEEISRHDESFSDTNSEHISIQNLTSQLDIHKRQIAIPPKQKEQIKQQNLNGNDEYSPIVNKQHKPHNKQLEYEVEADIIFNDYFSSFENYKKTPIEQIQALFKEVNEDLIHQCDINKFTPFFKQFNKTHVYSLINYDFNEHLMNLYFKLMTFYNIFLRNSNETNLKIVFLDLNFFQSLQESSHLKSFGSLYKKYESDFTMGKGDSIIFDQPNSMIVVPIYVYINLANSDSKKLFMALINFSNKNITFFDSDDVLNDNPEVVNNYKILFESFFAYLMEEKLSKKDLTKWQCESDSIDSMCYEEEYAVIIMVYYTQLICKTGKIRLISDKEYPIIKENMFKEIAGFYAKLHQHIK